MKGDTTRHQLKLYRSISSFINVILIFQLRVEARRQFEVTEQVAYATVNVIVARNEFEPRFTSSEFRRDQLSERVDVGTSIITVRAEDRDGVRIFRTNIVFIFELLLYVFLLVTL